MNIRNADALNRLSNLRCPVGKKSNRDADAARPDAVSDLLAACRTPGDLARTAYRFGVPVEEIFRRAKTASSFGQFRIQIGARIRRICRRLRQHVRDGGRIHRQSIRRIGESSGGVIRGKHGWCHDDQCQGRQKNQEKQGEVRRRSSKSRVEVVA